MRFFKNPNFKLIGNAPAKTEKKVAFYIIICLLIFVGLYIASFYI